MKEIKQLHLPSACRRSVSDGNGSQEDKQRSFLLTTLLQGQGMVQQKRLFLNEPLFYTMKSSNSSCERTEFVCISAQTEIEKLQVLSEAVVYEAKYV